MSIEQGMLILFISLISAFLYFEGVAYILSPRKKKLQIPKFEFKKESKRPVESEIDLDFFHDLQDFEDTKQPTELHDVDIDIPIEVQLLDDLDN
jgi:hypothetical protein